jgi:hypothetical protein
MGVNGQLHAPAALHAGERASGTHWMGGWVGPRTDLDAMEKIRKFHYCPCRELNPGRPARGLVTVLMPI